MSLHCETRSCHCQAAWALLVSFAQVYRLWRLWRFWRSRDCCGLWDVYRMVDMVDMVDVVGWVVWNWRFSLQHGRSLTLLLLSEDIPFVLFLSYLEQQISMNPWIPFSRTTTCTFKLFRCTRHERFVWTMKLRSSHCIQFIELVVLPPRALHGASQPHQHGDHAPQFFSGPEVIPNLTINADMF